SCRRSAPRSDRRSLKHVRTAGHPSGCRRSSHFRVACGPHESLTTACRACAATRTVRRPPKVPGSLSRKEVIAHMSFLTALIASFRKDEEGQGLAEYALILALIAIVAIIALIFLGQQVSTIISKVGSSIYGRTTELRGSQGPPAPRRCAVLMELSKVGASV